VLIIGRAVVFDYFGVIFKQADEEINILDLPGWYLHFAGSSS